MTKDKVALLPTLLAVNILRSINEEYELDISDPVFSLLSFLTLICCVDAKTVIIFVNGIFNKPCL